MRSYTIASTALVLDVPRKWIDNVIAQHGAPGIERRGRGVEVHVPPDALLVLAVAARLAREPGLPLRRAVAVAQTVCLGAAGYWTSAGTEVSITVDLDRVRRELAGRLIDAAESPARGRRGRPPGRRPPPR